MATQITEAARLTRSIPSMLEVCGAAAQQQQQAARALHQSADEDPE
jgi:hypothetical protein